MFEGRSQEVVRDISNVKQEIISYRKIIKPERSTLRVLERRVEGFLPEDLEDYFDDIVDAAERIWDLLDNYKEVVDGLESTNESVLAHRQNDVLRLLTVISVTILPLTLVTGALRDERPLSRRGNARGVLGDRRRAARHARRHARLLPLARLAVAGVGIAGLRRSIGRRASGAAVDASRSALSDVPNAKDMQAGTPAASGLRPCRAATR